jgi:hypothetical protein
MGTFALWGGAPISAQAQGVEVRFVSISSPVRTGQPATRVVQTLGGAHCGIDKRNQLGPSKWPGLMPQRADERGPGPLDVAG